MEIDAFDLQIYLLLSFVQMHLDYVIIRWRISHGSDLDQNDQ